MHFTRFRNHLEKREKKVGKKIPPPRRPSTRHKYKRFSISFITSRISIAQHDSFLQILLPFLYQTDQGESIVRSTNTPRPSVLSYQRTKSEIHVTSHKSCPTYIIHLVMYVGVGGESEVKNNFLFRKGLDRCGQRCFFRSSNTEDTRKLLMKRRFHIHVGRHTYSQTPWALKKQGVAK